MIPLIVGTAVHLLLSAVQCWALGPQEGEGEGGTTGGGQEDTAAPPPPQPFSLLWLRLGMKWVFTNIAIFNFYLSDHDILPVKTIKVLMRRCHKTRYHSSILQTLWVLEISWPHYFVASFHQKNPFSSVSNYNFLVKACSCPAAPLDTPQEVLDECKYQLGAGDINSLLPLTPFSMISSEILTLASNLSFCAQGNPSDPTWKLTLEPILRDNANRAMWQCEWLNLVRN